MQRKIHYSTQRTPPLYDRASEERERKREKKMACEPREIVGSGKKRMLIRRFTT